MADDLVQQARQIALQEIVHLLNEGFDKDYRDHAEAHANLIQLVKAWQDAQVAPQTRFERENDAPLPALLKMSLPPGCPNWPEVEKRCRAFLLPSHTGAYPHVQYVGEEGKAWTAWDFAILFFVQLLTNPEHDKVGGPCTRCGKYYVKKRASQKVYCSRICGNAATAVVRTRKKWDEERGERLKQADKAMRKWSRLKTTEPFQDWAEQHYPALTKKFLTRAIHNQELPIRKE
jgi:hypothetical protein